MAKKSSEYWKDRFVAVEAMNHNRATKAVNQVVPGFDSAQRQIEKELAVWYQRFADNNEISLADAKKLLQGKDLQELKWDIDEYIKYGRQNALNEQWLKELENASAKYHISRLEALQIRTQQATEVAFGNEVDVLDKLIASTYTADYYHTAYEIQKGMGIGFDVGRIDNEKLQRIMSKPWTADGLTFSDRIWRSKAQLLDSLDKELTQMCILGKAPDTAIANIAKRLQVSKSQAGRLIMTESAYFASEAQRQCFNDLDVEQYEIVATLDSHTSDICQSMDGQVFKMSEFQAGVTAPPFHVWCRSTTVPFFDDEWGREGTRAARGEDGKKYQVPADMKYPEWKKAFVDGGIQAEEVTLESLESEFMKLTEGYSYNEFMKDFGSIEEGFEGSTTAEIQKAKEISSKIEELKKTILPEATISRTLSAEERLQNIGISFSNSSKTDISNNIPEKYADFVTTFESEHPAYFNENTVPLKSIEIVDDIKGVSASGLYKQSEQKIQVKASSIKSKSKIVSHSDDVEMHSFVHEYGHYISDSLEANAGITEADIVQRSINRYFDGDIFKGPKDLKDILSSYGSTSYQEAFAEAFAEAYTSKEPGKFARIFKEELESAMANVALEKSLKNGTISAGQFSARNMANGLRRSPMHILTEKEISVLKEEAKSIGIPLEVLRFNKGTRTSFRDTILCIDVRGDVLPDLYSTNVRDLLPSRAVLAHEYYGHYKAHPSTLPAQDWRDEFRASYRAAINTPNLSDEERRLLMLDAYDRAKEAGVKVKYNKKARELIYGIE